MGTIGATLLMGILIAGAIAIYRVHRERAATIGVTLEWHEVFTRFPPPARTSQEQAVRDDVRRALVKWLGAWLVLNFIVGLLIAPVFRA